MVLGFILTDSQPGKCIFDQFPSRFQDFGTFPRRLHGLQARYLSGLRPGRPNSDKSGFPGQTEKLRAEKSCRLMVVSHRVLHFPSLLCPFKIVDVQLILLISGAFHLRIRPSECTLNLSVNRREGPNGSCCPTSGESAESADEFQMALSYRVYRHLGTLVRYGMP